MPLWTDLPPDIATILRAMQQKAKSDADSPRFFSIFFLDDGNVQVNVQNPKNKSSFSVSINPDPCVALAEALGPKPPRGSWKEHLKAPAEPVDDDDDFDVV